MSHRHLRPVRSVPPARRAVALVATLVVGGLALAACSGPAPEPSRSTAATATSGPTATPTPTPAPTDSAAPEAPTTPAPTTPPAVPAFDKGALSIDDPASPWVVSDKLRPLRPADWAPTDLVTMDVAAQNPPVLRREAADAVVAMFAAGEAEGAGAFQVQSAYRSYATQVTVYDGWVAQLGQEAADATSARPGTCEHQTGLALDISPVPLSCALQACFGETPQGRWLAENSWRFGFVLRYPQGATPITGYEYEPWHFRYVGVPLATELHSTGTATLEEFFGLPPAPDYAG